MNTPTVYSGINALTLPPKAIEQHDRDSGQQDDAAS